jgi:hypothetical protein
VEIFSLASEACCKHSFFPILAILIILQVGCMEDQCDLEGPLMFLRSSEYSMYCPGTSPGLEHCDISTPFSLLRKLNPRLSNSFRYSYFLEVLPGCIMSSLASVLLMKPYPFLTLNHLFYSNPSLL